MDLYAFLILSKSILHVILLPFLSMQERIIMPNLQSPITLRYVSYF